MPTTVWQHSVRHEDERGRPSVEALTPGQHSRGRSVLLHCGLDVVLAFFVVIAPLELGYLSRRALTAFMLTFVVAPIVVLHGLSLLPNAAHLQSTS